MMSNDARMDADGITRDLPAILVEYAGAMSKQSEPRDILERLGSYCNELLPVDGVGALLRDGADGMIVATSDTEPGRIVEELETALNEGPCAESMATGEQILVPDLAAAVDRYPRFVPRALEAGVRSIHALPLTVRVEQVGSLDLIAMKPMDLTAEHLATAQMLCDVTIAYLANTAAFRDSTKLAQQLQHALDSRIIIEQAKGKLSEREGITVTEAFEKLRRYARGKGARLHDVAHAFMSGDLEL